jgi:hypothetical protein
MVNQKHLTSVIRIAERVATASRRARLFVNVPTANNVANAREYAERAAAWAGHLSREGDQILREAQSLLRTEAEAKPFYTGRLDSSAAAILDVVNRELYRRYLRGGSTLQWHRRVATEEV